VITLTVYFHGPMTEWAGQAAAPEIVASKIFRWRWLARLHARQVMDGLNAGRCGYLIQRGEDVLEHFKAPNQGLQ
jgi:hypothetical protein